MSERDRLIAAVNETQQVMAGFFAQEQSRLILDSPLTMAQLKMLIMLRIHGPVGGNELATRLHVSVPSVSGMVDRLEVRGLVERREDPVDRRVRLVGLSDAGASMIADYEAAGREISNEVLGDLELDDLRALVRGLGAVRGAVVRRAERRGADVPSPCPERLADDGRSDDAP